MKKKIPSIFLYSMNIIIFFLPWLMIEDKEYNIFGFTYHMMADGLDTIIWKNGIDYIGAEPLKIGIILELILFALYIAGTFLYLMKVIKGKSSKLNFFNLGVCVPLLVIHMSGISLGAMGANVLGAASILIIFLITAFEIPVRVMIDGWEEARKIAREYEIQEKLAKQEEKERLAFKGKYTNLFYRFVWKNFGKNWRDYLLLLLSNAVIYRCMVVGFGVKQVLSAENTTKGSQLFNGLDRILVNAMFPIGMISIFIFVLLFFYYVKCRARNFGIFLTLGMRRNMLYRLVAIEYISMLGLAIILGGGIHLKAIVILLFISIVSLMAARDIFKDFNVGHSTDLREIGERIPIGSRKVFGLVGAMICGISIFRYQNLDNFENVALLVEFFAGMFLVIRFGMAELLVRERRKPAYLKKMLLHSQLYHKSKTNAGYIGALFIMHFSVLFYFMFQVISINIAEDVEELYPYDVVCLADESDTEMFGRLKEEYGVVMEEYPTVRISAYDGTEKTEDHRSGMPFQSQHIGISESTYHELKRAKDEAYVAKNLGLDNEGEYIHIVYQQDKSEHAKPTGFFSPRSKPLLHIGQPCRNLQVHRVNQENVSYHFYKVKSEEITSLTGVFHQGMKENIIVFSDEYFEKAKEMWKVSHVYRGIYIDEKEAVLGENIHQGVTKLVLMNVEDKYLQKVKEELTGFEEKHLEKEKEVFRGFAKEGVYDLSISYHYMKEEAVKNLLTERTMKLTMNELVIGIFFFMNMMLIIIKLLSEKDVNKRRTEFLTCMGMRKKDRVRLIKGEVLRYFLGVPMILAVIFAALFTGCVFHARMYNLTDIKAYLGNMIPLWAGYMTLSTVVIWVMITIYAYKMEGDE